MIKSLEFKSKLLYDGTSQHFYENAIELYNKLYSVNIIEFKYFNKIKNDFVPSDVLQILSELKDIRQSDYFPDSYIGRDQLPLKYKVDEKENVLIIVSHGEFQPGRYKLYLEGIWKI